MYGELSKAQVIEKNTRFEYKDLPHGVTEETPLDFYSPYGCSKGAADQYVRDYHRIYGMKTVVFRQSCIYGTRQFGLEDQGWVAWFVIASLLGKKITIFGDGKQVRDILWINDLVNAYVKAYEKKESCEGRIFNIGGAKDFTLSLLELISLLKQEAVIAEDPGFADWRQGDQKVFVSNVDKFKALTGWEAKVSPEEGIHKLIHWTRENLDLVKKILS